MKKKYLIGVVIAIVATVLISFVSSIGTSYYIKKDAKENERAEEISGAILDLNGGIISEDN